jgi:hypothetical protein
MHTLSFSPLFFLNEIISPLNQFEIRNILTVFGFNLSFTITTLGFYLIIGSFLLLSPSFLATNFDNLIANK